MRIGLPLALAVLALAVALVVAGAAMIYRPAALILAGLALGAFISQVDVGGGEQ